MFRKYCAQKSVWALSYTRKITRQSAPIPHPRHRAVQFQTKTLSVSAFSHTFVNPPDHQIRYHLSFFFLFCPVNSFHTANRVRVKPLAAMNLGKCAHNGHAECCRNARQLALKYCQTYSVVGTVHVPPRRTQPNALALSFPPMSWLASSDKKSSASKSTSAA